MRQLSPPPASSTSSRLLAAAAALFRSKGYAATSTRELAKLLGIQNASLYYHMGKKEDLLYALSVDALSRIHSEVEQAIAERTTPAERLSAMIHTHVTKALEDQDKHATMLFELRSLSDDRRAEVIQKRAAYEALVRETIAEAQAAGVVRPDIDAKFLTLAMLNLLNWSIFWFNPDGPLTSRQLAELFTTLFMEGVALRVSPHRPMDVIGRSSQAHGGSDDNGTPSISSADAK